MQPKIRLKQFDELIREPGPKRGPTRKAMPDLQL